jgi:pyruvate dehydrogenase E1 component beta subunit
MREITFGQAVLEALDEEMERDERVFYMGEDVGRFGMIYLANRKLYEKYGEERVRDIPLCENALVGFALGAAITGMRPVAEIMFCDLMTCAAEQIVNQVAKIRYMFGGNIKVPLVIRTTVSGSRRTAAQHSQHLEAWFTHIPGLKVVMPSSPYTAKGLLKTAIRDPNPVIMIDHQMLLRLGAKGPVPEEEYLLPFGQAEIMREGKDVTVVATSLMVNKALNVAQELEKQGIQIEVIDPRTLIPLDKDTILRSVKKTGRLLVVHQACKTSGFGAEIAAMVAEEGFDYLVSPIRRVAAPDVPVPFSPIMEDFVIPNEERIVREVLAMMKQ